MEADFSCANCLSRVSRSSVVFSLMLVSGFAIGCGGSSGNGGSNSTRPGNTAVVLLASSTANDQLSEFSVTLNNLTLVDDSGKSVTVLSAPVSDDFIHVNGQIEPLATVIIPQGNYVSAQVSLHSAYPECAGQTPGQLILNESLGAINPGAFQVNLPQPLMIAGKAMGLVLNLQVAASAPFGGGCSSSLSNAVTVTPHFDLEPLTIAAQPTNRTNGRMQGVRGIVSAVSAGGNGFTVGGYASINAGHPPVWQISFSGSTVFQGISNASQLAAGMPVDMDLNIQPDGSLLATRVAVPDTDTATLSTAYGPSLASYPAGAYGSTSQVIDALQVGQSGYLPSGHGLYSIDNATFQVSDQFANLQSLPFTPSFSAANMVDGQNIFFSLHVPLPTTLPPPMMRVELLPQTIDGTVSAVSTSGSFTAYTVTLAAYNLFPNLAVQPGQTTLLSNPNTVVVYADSSTQMLNSKSLAVGGVFRFYGLVFNDNGTLRMDCAQVSDGVAE